MPRSPRSLPEKTRTSPRRGRHSSPYDETRRYADNDLASTSNASLLLAPDFQHSSARGNGVVPHGLEYGADERQGKGACLAT
jgi:hypothetical protein